MKPMENGADDKLLQWSLLALNMTYLVEIEN